MEELSDRFRLILPDLPLHGDSEDRPRHPYSPDWMAEVMAGFCRDVCGPRPLVGGHEAGAQILLRAVVTRQLSPGRLVLMPNAMHRRPERERLERAAGLAIRSAAVPGLDRLVSHAGRLAYRPPVGEKLTARQPRRARPRPARVRRRRRQREPCPRLGARGAALADRRAERPARRLPADRGADAAAVGRRGPHAPARDRRGGARPAPARAAARARGTGFLMAYDDPVGLARELKAFCV